MGNYNPRQNTRMRWKDERELEKFSFLYGGFASSTRFGAILGTANRL